jgi:hypothetical protein
MDEEIRVRGTETGSEFPRFRINNSDPFEPDFFFHGPLFRVILSQGQNAPGHPLPRLLIPFFRAFVEALEVWRGPNLIRWAQNRSLLVGLARRFVRNTALYSFYPSHLKRTALQRIILSCEHCTAAGPCILCEFNTHSIAFLCKAERPRLIILQLFRLKAPEGVVSRIADFAEGRADLGFRLTYLRDCTIHNCLWIQVGEFAPEIRSIIDRHQFITWVEGVIEGRLRPYNQPARSPSDQRAFQHSYPPDWPIEAYLLRAHPCIVRDPEFPPGVPNITAQGRLACFLTIEDYHFGPSYQTIQASRHLNSDLWRLQRHNRGNEEEFNNRSGSRYIWYDRLEGEEIDNY